MMDNFPAAETATDHRLTGTATGFDHRPMGIETAIDCHPTANRGTYRREIAVRQTETGSHPTDRNQNCMPKQVRSTIEIEGNRGAYEYDQTAGKLVTDLL